MNRAHHFLPGVIVAISVTLTILGTTSRAKAADLTIYTEDYKPFYFEDGNGQVKGIITELVKKVAASADIAISLRLRPFKRGLMAVENNTNHCFMALWRTEAREPNFSWVGPLQVDGFAYFALEKSPIALNKHEDSFDYRTGAVAGWTSTQQAEREGHRNLTLVDNDHLNLEMLAAGRIDLWLGGLLSAPYLAERFGLEIKNVYTLSEVDLSLACNPQTDPNLIAQLRRALTQVNDHSNIMDRAQQAAELTQ